MNEDITERIVTLCEEFQNGKYTVQEFQFRLEPSLFSYPRMIKEVEAQFRRFINELEVILYTLPEKDQYSEALRVANAVLNFVGGMNIAAAQE